MCTCGAIRTKDRDGKQVILLGKTLDFYESGYWHGIISHPDGISMLGCGLVPQIGINSGMNDKGLAVLLSYLDYRGPFEEQDIRKIPDKWHNDDRALINAQMLAKCSNVEEAIAFLYEQVPRYPHMPGGNHMLADRKGTLAVFEHCAGEMNHRYYNEEGFVARGNNGFLVIKKEQEQLPGLVRQDRNLRYSQMASVLRDVHGRSMSYDEILQSMMKALAFHNEQSDRQVGSICIHDQILPGARASTSLPLTTVTALIFSLNEHQMHYTVTPPCQGAWHTMGLKPWEVDQ